MQSLRRRGELTTNGPMFFLRTGSNAEKKIVEKTASMFSGVLLRANYFESAAGSLSVFLLKYAQGSNRKGYIIDPTTYVFALSPHSAGSNNSQWSIRSWKRSIRESNARVLLRRDLRMDAAEPIQSDWIRPFIKDNRDMSPMVQYWGITSAYRKLADYYFDEPVAKQAGRREILPPDLGWTPSGGAAESLTRFVVKTTQYQLNAVRNALEGSGLPDLDGVRGPEFVLSPYFYISKPGELAFMSAVWSAFRHVYEGENGAAVLLVDKGFLSQSLDEVVNALLASGLKYVFFWIPALNEEHAQKSSLYDMAELVTRLGRQGVGTINLYAGGFSTALLQFGLQGIVNGPGYGMDRDVQPVKGGMPQAKYYLPQAHVREDINDTLEIVAGWPEATTREGFLSTVCNCPICRDGIRHGWQDIVMYYGESVRARNGTSDRYVPSQRALERCAFHFIFARLMEYSRACSTDKVALIELLRQDAKKCGGKADYVSTWADLLQKYVSM